MIKIFLSYSHEDKQIADELASTLSKLKYHVWLDDKINTGKQWWDEIIQEIDMCELFVCLLSETYIRSDACKKEYHYAAVTLNKSIIPISVGPLDFKELDPKLAAIQITEYKRDPTSLASLIAALNDAELSPNLPSPHPKPPPAPISPVMHVAQRLQKQKSMTFDEQHSIVSQLECLIEHNKSEADAHKLLAKMRKRAELEPWILKKINGLSNLLEDTVTIFGYFYTEDLNQIETVLIRHDARFPFVKQVNVHTTDIQDAIDCSIVDFMKSLELSRERLIKANPQEIQWFMLYNTSSDDPIPMPLIFCKLRLNDFIQSNVKLWKDEEFQWVAKQGVAEIWREPGFNFGTPDGSEPLLKNPIDPYKAINLDKIYKQFGLRILEGVDVIIFRQNEANRTEFLLMQRSDKKPLGPLKWEYCKGGLYYHETSVEAGLREILEEAHISSDDLVYCGNLGKQLIDVKGRKKPYDTLLVEGQTFFYTGRNSKIHTDIGHLPYEEELNWKSYDEAVKEIAWLEDGYGVEFFRRWKSKENEIMVRAKG